MTQTGKPRIPAGDTFTLIFDVVDHDDAPVNLTGVDIDWTMMRDESDDEVPILTKSVGSGITIDPVVINRYRVQLNPGDTIALDSRDYWHKSIVTLLNGNVATVSRAWLTILP